MRLTPLDTGMEVKIRDEYEQKVRDIEAVIGITAKLLSGVTKYTSVVSGPRIRKSRFKHLQLIQLDDRNILVVIVTDPGFVQNRIIESPRTMSPEELDKMSYILNRRLRGLTINDIGSALMEEIKSEIVNNYFFDQAMDLIHHALEHVRKERVFMDGTSHVLNQPEFRNIEKARVLLGMLEDEDHLVNMLEEAASLGGVQITIGHENRMIEMQDCSVISASYRIGSDVAGSIAVLGPTRMEYEKVISVVRFMADTLSGILSGILK
jgi:heat-inducible transcriptional repressor